MSDGLFVAFILAFAFLGAWWWISSAPSNKENKWNPNLVCAQHQGVKQIPANEGHILGVVCMDGFFIKKDGDKHL